MSVIVQAPAASPATRRWHRDVSVGILIGLLSALFAVSHAALIFSGELAGWLPIGIAGGVIACIGMMVAHAVAGSVPYGIGATDSSSISILAVIVAGTVAALPPGIAPETRLATAVGTVAATVGLSGLALVGVGMGKLGRIARFLPYPVVGGFMGGSGVLVLKGATSFLGVDSWLFADWSAIPLALGLQWSAAIAAAAILWLAGWTKHPLAVPGAIIGLTLLLHLGLVAGGVGPAEARATGWLPPLNDAALPLWPLHLAAGFDPWLLLGQAGNILALTLIVILSVLMHASGIEVQTQQAVDVDRELTASGIGNLLVAAMGGIGGNLSLSRSVMAQQFGATGRVTGWAAAGACVLLLVAALPVLSYLPRPILGAMLIQVGILLLKSWVIDAAFRLSRVDYLLVLLLIATIAVAGFVTGIVIGLLVASLIFVVSYSRTPVVRYAPTLADHRSGTDRPFHHRRLLEEHGNEGWVLCLQGFLFFGTASSLLQLVAERIDNAALPRLRVLVVDFRLVTGIDGSAAFSFLKMLRLLREREVTLVCSSLSAELEKILRDVDSAPDDDGAGPFAPDLDRAIELAEDHLILRRAEASPSGDLADDAIAAIFPDAGERGVFRRALEQVELPAGMPLIEQGQHASDLYFLGQGRLTVLIGRDESEKRLRTLGPGSIVGELGMLLDERRSASVICDEDSVLYRLSAEAFDGLRRDHPAVATHFYAFVLRVLADRLTHANRAVNRLLG